MPFARLQASHVMTTVPAAATTFTNSGEKTAGGMENVGTATSSTFTMAEEIKCIDTYSVPPNTPSPTPPPYDGLEVGAVPVISLTNISLPTPWTVPATGKSESLSGLGAAPNNTGAVENTFKDKLTEEVTMDVTQDYKINLTTTIGALGSIKASAAMVVGGSSISFN